MKKFLKAVFLAAAVCALAAALAGCSQSSSSSSANSPTSVAKSALGAVKTAGFGALDSYTDGNVTIGDSTSALDDVSAADSTTDAQKSIIQSYAEKMLAYDFELSNEKISGDTATVTVTFKTYDCATPLQEALNVFVQKSVTEAISGAISGASDTTDGAKYTAFFFDELKSQLDAQTDKTKTFTGTITFTKKNDVWLISGVDDATKNGLTGGLNNYFANIQSSLTSLTSN